MSLLQRQLVLVILAVLSSTAIPASVVATDRKPTLLRIGKPPITATLASPIDDGTLVFSDASQEIRIEPGELVGWSTRQITKGRSELILIDGSRLGIDESWTGKPSLQFAEGFFNVSTTLMGKLRVSVDHVLAIILYPGLDRLQRTRFVDRLIRQEDSTGLVHLANGDVFNGTLLSIGMSRTGEYEVALQLVGLGENHTIAINRIAALTLHTGTIERGAANEPRSPNPGEPGVLASETLAAGSSDYAALSKKENPRDRLIVGLRDGSTLVCRRIRPRGDLVQLQLACDIEPPETHLREIVHLQSLSSSVVYLSDLEPVEYRHEPYLDIPWDFFRDRNALGGELAARGLHVTKGLGMHSASRLTFSIPEGTTTDFRPKRFVAELAIDDLAAGQGSAFFRVYLLKADGWELTYSSPVVRGVDEPLPISIDLSGSQQIALASDYADRGDERDYANWMGARFE